MSFVYTNHIVFAEFPDTTEFLQMMQSEEFKEMLERASEGAFDKRKSESLYCVKWTFSDSEQCERAERQLNAMINYFNKLIELKVELKG